MYRIGLCILERGTGLRVTLPENSNTESELITCKVEPLAFSKNVAQSVYRTFTVFLRVDTTRRSRLEGRI